MGTSMRKLILIAVLSLVATEAFAAGPRSLSLAATDASQQAAEQPAATVAPQSTQAPEGRAAVQTTTTTPTPPPAAPAATAATAAQSTATPASGTTGSSKAKRRQPSFEARVIRELHRHGIYW
ncbi:hypothetical protein [Bradyrhizobium sp. 179]|uniref:hypothetical protein n=2 Tax=unclassified Bradyrhizobium TaxID=2631580 RepID=UPI001FFB65CD|nr:hypothetical protein [Bradyrhizobium sp. 179]